MNLPTGTVTLLFAEVERGTGPLQQVSDVHLPVASLRQALLFALQTHNAFLLSMDDESLRAGFSTPTEALDAAVAIQQIFHPERAETPAAFRPTVQRFCVALHTGRAEVEAGQYVGDAVWRTVQLMEAGHSGQILVSADCARALQSRLSAGVRLIDLGKFQYPGVAEGETVFQAVHADLPEEFPPLRLAGASANNLPVSWTSFVGRDAELSELKRLLAATRFLTLIGSEGIGKSRLAIRLVSDLRAGFPDGVWLAELPSIADIDIVPGAVAWALNAQAGPETTLTDALVTRLRDKKALLLLDAGEANIAACGRLVTALAGPCPAVKFVVCARKGLGLRDEAVYCVPPMATTGGEGGSDVERLCQDRAARVPAPLEFDGPMLSELGALLHGIPMAVEIALGGLVSRPEESFNGMIQSLHALTWGEQRSWEQTLHLVLDWGYLRLAETERILLERLSVFQAGWSLEGATAVCCDEIIPADLLPALLESLRACGFIAAEERAGFTRERLCDAVRNYAQARLHVRGEAAELHRRHADYFLQLAEQGALGLTGPDQEGWKAYLEREYINFRVALHSVRQEEEGESREPRFAAALLPILSYSGRPAEGRALLTRATEGRRAPVAHEEYASARSRGLSAIERCHFAGDRITELRHLENLARLALANEDFATAKGCYEHSIEIYRELGDRAQEARTLHRLGSAARDGEDYPVARHYYEQALELNRSLGRRNDEAHNLNGLARLALLQGDSAEAARRFQEGLVLFRALGERAWEAHNMGQILRLSLPSEPLWERIPIHKGVGADGRRSVARPYVPN